MPEEIKTAPILKPYSHAEEQKLNYLFSYLSLLKTETEFEKQERKRVIESINALIKW